MKLTSVFNLPIHYICAVESSSVPLQQQQQPQSRQPQNHTKNAKRKKSVMLNLKSGAINSVTFEVFGNYSTRFAGDTQRRRKCLLIGGIVLSCLCFFAFGIAVSKLFEAETCKCKSHSLGRSTFFHVNDTDIGIWCVRDRVVFLSAKRTHVLRRYRSLVRTHSRFFSFFSPFIFVVVQRNQRGKFAWRKIVFEQVSTNHINHSIEIAFSLTLLKNQNVIITLSILWPSAVATIPQWENS